MSENNLKPCPFCGGNAVMHEPDDGPYAGGVFIECAKCKASSVLMYPEKCNGLDGHFVHEAINHASSNGLPPTTVCAPRGS